ncbi:hypothetical protein P171DRAFT_473247 [Karstenula rhodostoma CBS 690.94]|uniref:Uncharacterized protein n=1 Tax=Karstenula rhodostoma CBS 690.94 TaxID=1392251 RepID=A0A9P4UC75_9PLEO|nr:hypothetical protein P171DRAFT_473247 [Karstenula rhodostoma CBS 690.94]
MSSSSYRRNNARLRRRLAQPSRTPSIRPPSSHSNQRPSPGLSAAATSTPLWGPALWSSLLAAGRPERITPTPRSESRVARPVSPQRSRPPRNLRNKTLACLNEDSDSSSEEELGEIIVTKSRTRQSNASNRHRRISTSVGEADNMLPTAKVKAPPVSKKKTPKAKKSLPKKTKSIRPAIVLRKRSPPQQEEERAPKIQKTDQMGSNATASKQGSPQRPILLDDSDDDTPLTEVWSQPRPTLPIKEEAQPQKSFFSGLGAQSLGNTWSFSTNNAGTGASAVRAAEDADLQPTPTIPVERSIRSASQNFDLYQKTVADSARNANRITELELELGSCQSDCKARIEALKLENEATLRRLNQEHNTTVELMRQEQEASLKSQADAQRLETKCLLDDIQRTAASQDDQKTRRITALEVENESLKDENLSLKGQLHAEKTAHSMLMQSLDQREVLVPTEDSVKALEASNAALNRELQALKQQHRDSPSSSQCHSQDMQATARPERDLSPTPTLSSLHPSDETKTTNVRNTFLKTKRRHDKLLTVAKKIRDVTSGMDLSGFGDFGKCVLEQRMVLKSVLEEDSGGGGRQGGRGGDGEK